MLRVSLPLWGVAVGLFTASTVAGQTPEPPAAFPYEPPSSVAPDLFRQVTAELNNPLLSLMVDGQLTSLEAEASQDSTRLKPKADTKSAPAEPSNPCPDGAVADGTFPCEIECPTVPCYLPYAYPQQQSCGHKCHRRQKGSCFGGHGQGCGNAYGYGGYGWGGCPSCYGGQSYGYQGCTGHKCHGRHGCGHQNCGGGYGYPGWGGCAGAFGPMNYDGYMDGCFGCGYAPPQQGCHGHKCHKRGCGNNCGGYAGYGYPSWGGYGGFGGCDGCFAPPPPPPPQSGCRFCHKHKSQNCSWANNGYPGWPAYPVPGANQWDDGFNSFTDPNCYGSGGCRGKHCCACCHKQHHCFSHFRHGHCGHYRTPQYPYAAYPMTTPCFAMDDFCSDCCIPCDGPAPATGSSGSSGAKKK